MISKYDGPLIIMGFSTHYPKYDTLASEELADTGRLLLFRPCPMKIIKEFSVLPLRHIIRSSCVLYPEKRNVTEGQREQAEQKGWAEFTSLITIRSYSLCPTKLLYNYAPLHQI
jgi:hypothetical protein